MKTEEPFVKKPTIELIRREDANDPTKRPELYACGNCGQISSPRIYVASEEKAHKAAKEWADTCCMPRKCERDGCHVMLPSRAASSWTVCELCRDREDELKTKKLVEKAKRYTVTDAPDHPVWDEVHSEWYESATEFCDRMEDGDQLDPLDFPMILWLAEREAAQVDFDGWLESFAESLELDEHTDINSVTVGLKELESAFSLFNAANAAQQPPKLWRQAYAECVIVEYSDVYPDAARPVTMGIEDEVTPVILAAEVEEITQPMRHEVHDELAESSPCKFCGQMIWAKSGAVLFGTCHGVRKTPQAKYAGPDDPTELP